MHIADIDAIEESWENCLDTLKNELSPSLFDTWIKPLQAKFNGSTWVLFAPNQFVMETVRERFLGDIQAFLGEVILEVGHGSTAILSKEPPQIFAGKTFESNLNNFFTFENFVEGKSNQVAKAAAMQVAKVATTQIASAQAYNPLLIYGGVGFGKTHLMQAAANEMCRCKPNIKVRYLHSERFVNSMINAIAANAINRFQEEHHALDALCIDDIQFFAGKGRSQEVLFHLFNKLLESGRQMIFTCDRYPKEIEGLEERLKSRFGWGLTVVIDPPELETRAAILLNKAAQMGIHLASEQAFFIAKRVRSNVRELEGALKRVAASAQFTGREITIELIKEALRDLIALQDKLITIENIQKTVAGYYKIKMSDLLSKNRSRSVTRPRQMAMLLAKELTNHSLPEIGEAFGGKDHTTVLHACRVMTELRESQQSLEEDFKNLMRILSA